LLGYAEFGDPDGKPAFFFHGLPGSRLFRHPDDSIAEALGVRLITVDRPGFGLSSFQPQRQLLDWPNDVLALADTLGLDRFAVAGASAGGPHAAACAFKIPQRLSAVALVSSAAPAQVPGATAGMAAVTRASFAVAGCGCLPWWILWPMMIFSARTGRRHPERLWQQIVAVSPPSDRALLLQPEVKAIILATLPETYRQGGKGHLWEARLIARRWGFQLEDIAAQVYLWHGTADMHAPLEMGRYLANTIPRCQATFLSGEGHLMMFKPELWHDILATLVA
jgi:pimeloyl-ACP methyl ester carboxylesterase